MWRLWLNSPDCDVDSRGSSYPEKARPHERRRPEEALAAAEAALGSGEDEAEEEGVDLGDSPTAVSCYFMLPLFSQEARLSTAPVQLYF